MADEGFNVPTDALVEILLRLPTSARWRFRLVCKLWRGAIDQRTPERQVRTKILTFISHGRSSRATVFDDKDGHRRHEWTYNSSTHGGTIHMVGTCNGLICLHDTGDSDCSVITVTNPVTGEATALPPVPARDSFGRLGIYGFGYHPVTGQYKVVHVPSLLAPRRDVGHVLTLGDGPASWREVVSPAMAESYNAFCGIVGIDGSVYWFTSRANRVMALDLEDERVTSFRGPPGVRPVKMPWQASWQVTSVHARLGVAIPCYEAAATVVEVWVLNGGSKELPRWSRRYCLSNTNSIVMAPHLTHGEYIVSRSLDGDRMYRRKVDDGGGGTDGVDRRAAPLDLSEGAEVIMNEETEGCLRTFAYIETREPVPSAGQ
ncbi:unnamed protein product [Urochloa decumbens]|uniref:F-box domain-containing protein n=1 Tax=Urochloa decumbens TaxID=240449 RepID=A0ABC9C256_9POAL